MKRWEEPTIAEARHRVALRRMGGGANACSVAPKIGAFAAVSFC
jgi:hypothetical protein